MVKIKEIPNITKINGKTLVDEYNWMKTNKEEATNLIKNINKETDKFLNNKKKLHGDQLTKEDISYIINNFTIKAT